MDPVTGRIWVALLLVACASGAAGDWEAQTLTTDVGEAEVGGVLEVDRDGETLLRLQGNSADLRARGQADVDGDAMTLDLTGTLFPAQEVSVVGDCWRSEREMDCLLDVAGETWELRLLRERSEGLRLD